MLQKVVEYAKQLFRMRVPKSVIEETSRIFEVLPETAGQLSDATIPLEKRMSIIDSIFPTEVRDTLRYCAMTAFSVHGVRWQRSMKKSPMKNPPN
jgi:F-type H+-transporting ATPase subunit alpha